MNSTALVIGAQSGLAPGELRRRGMAGMNGPAVVDVGPPGLLERIGTKRLVIGAAVVAGLILIWRTRR